MKQYIEIKQLNNSQNIDCTHIKCEVYYDKGGENQFTHIFYERGLYLSITPVVLSYPVPNIQSECYTAWTGAKAFLLPLNRKNDKKEKDTFTAISSELNTIAQSFIDNDKQRMIAAIFRNI